MNKALLSCVLSASLVLSPVVPSFGASVRGGSPGRDLFRAPLTQDEQILHALARLTFGARSGDLEAVRKAGLKKWIDLELHPDTIPENPELAAKLQPLASLQMPNDQLAIKYPMPQVIRAIAAGRAPMPQDPEDRVVVERLVERYRARLQNQGLDTAKADTANSEKPERTPLSDVLTEIQIHKLREGTPEEKEELLGSFSANKLGKLAEALPGGMRRDLVAYVPVEIRRKMLLSMSPAQVLTQDLSEGKLYRAVYSNRQLEEVLTDFWFNHFNIYMDKGADRVLTTSYERDAIRPYVLGNFKDLLLATAHSPAMLWYLDNWESTGADSAAGSRGKRKRGLNENYGRELLELHTMGVDGGYTQKDIIEVARCFTGWTIAEPYRNARFVFNPKMHDEGEKSVLGVKIPAGGGEEDGLKVIDILMNQPATAHFVATSLAQRFVADNPPESLLRPMALTFSETHGDLRRVMQTMLAAPEFWSKGAYRVKVKSPLEMVASAVRATGAEVNFAYGLAAKIADLGEPLYRKQEPTGYFNSGDQWVNSANLIARLNFALALAQNKLPGVKVDVGQFQGGPESIAKALLFSNLSPQTKQAIDQGTADKKEPSEIAGLLLGSPEFQRR